VSSLLTPPRRYDPEYLEDPTIDEEIVRRSLYDIARSNVVFLGTRAAVAELSSIFPQLGTEATLLDVGTGLGDIPREAQRVAARHGVTLKTIGIDGALVLAREARCNLDHTLCADVRALPFASRSVDIVMCSQVLHHFRDHDATALLREMNRVARVAVVVADLRRSWIAALGFWAASFPLAFHPTTRHDGFVSVMRSFTVPELADTVHDALGITPPVRRHLGFRVTTSWAPV